MESPTQTFLKPEVSRTEAQRIDFAPTRDRGDEPTPYDPKIEDFTMGKPLGSGGMGWVYEAYDTKLKRAVAVKVLSDRFSQTEVARRFKLEAQILARLKHPNIVPIFHSGQTDDGRFYFAMQRIEGGTLADAAEDFRERGATAIVPMLAKVARAVQYFHDHSIWHRDLKPSNILLDASGEPYVADFGVGKLLDGDDTTLGFHRVGTHAYMAPEMIKFGTKGCTAASDVWALGVIAYQLLAGVRPFGGDSQDPKLTQRICLDPVAPAASQKKAVDGFDTALEAIVERALAKAPENRYPTAAALAEDLEAWAAGKPVTALRNKRWKQWGRWASLAASLLLTVGIGIGLAMVVNRKNPDKGDWLSKLKPGQIETVIDGEGAIIHPLALTEPTMTMPLEKTKGALILDAGNSSFAEIGNLPPGFKIRLSAEIEVISGGEPGIMKSSFGLYCWRKRYSRIDAGRPERADFCVFNQGCWSPRQNNPTFVTHIRHDSGLFYLDRPGFSFCPFNPIDVKRKVAEGPGEYRTLSLVFDSDTVAATHEEETFPNLDNLLDSKLFGRGMLAEGGWRERGSPDPLFGTGFGIFSHRGTAGFRNVKVEVLEP